MAGTVGLWVNYATQKIFEVDEHERYIRRGNNARKMGVPVYVVKEFDDFKPTEDREKFLLFIFNKTPLMRVREHGNYATFEFNAIKTDKVFEAIKKVGDHLWFGDYTGLYIVNHGDNTSADILWKDFKKASQWADKVSELSESFTPKKMFPTIFDYAKEAKPMTESQKVESGMIIINDKSPDPTGIKSIVESIKNDD